MKLATHRTTKVPRKGRTIVQTYKKKLEDIATHKAEVERERAEDASTRDHLGITSNHYREALQYFWPDDRIDFSGLKKRRLAQALQGPQLQAPKDFQVELMNTKPLSWWKAIKAALFNPYG